MEHCVQSPAESFKNRPVEQPVKHVPLGGDGAVPPGATSTQKTRVDGALGSNRTTVNCEGSPSDRVPVIDAMPVCMTSAIFFG